MSRRRDARWPRSCGWAGVGVGRSPSRNRPFRERRRPLDQDWGFLTNLLTRVSKHIKEREKTPNVLTRAIRYVRKPDISDKRPTTFQALSCQKRQKHCQKRQKCQICQKTDHCRNSSSKAPAWPGVHSDHSVVDRAVIHGWQIPSTGPACALAGRVLVRPDRRNVRGLGGLLPRRGDG